MKSAYLPITLLAMASSSQAAISDLYITEVMANPGAVSDTSGEWFELYNPTGVAINLSGAVLSDNGSNSHVLGDISIAAGDYFVLARNGNSTVNGGFNADYVYSNFSLNNGSDQIVLTFNSIEMLRLDYSLADFSVAGRSMELVGLPMAEAQYALTNSTYVYGLGDIGTPGSAGSFTPPAAVPVPATAWLFGTGLAGLLGVSRRKKPQ